MDRLFSRLSLMAAVIFGFAITAVPLDVYVVNRRQLGIVRLTGFAFARAAAIGSFILAFYDAFRSAFKDVLRSPRFGLACASIALVLMVAGAVPVEGAVVLMGITAEEAREQINKLGTDMSAMLTKAKDEKRDLTADEETSFDKMDVDREALIKTERRLIVAAELENPSGRRSAAQPPVKNTNRREENPEDQRAASLARLEGMRSWLLAGSDRSITPEQREQAAKVGIDLTRKNLTFNLSQHALRSTKNDEVREWEKRALSSSSTSSPVDGQYTVADEIMRPLEVALLQFGGMRVRSTILRTETGADLPIPTTNDTSNKGEIIGQNTQINQQDVAFGQLVLQSFKYSSKMILVSVELLQDNAINLAEFLGTALGQRIGRITNDHFTTGDASSKPNGIVTASTASGTQLAAQTPTLAEMVAIQHSVDPAYRGNGAWMFHDSMLAEVKKIVDASSGRPIWMPTMAGGAPDTILGDPFVINQSMAAAAGSGAAKSILYGDLSKYLIRDVRNISLLRLDERFADYHQVAFLAFSRHDGDLLDAGTNPVKHGLNKA